jgi:hypothetical protein
MVSEEAKADLLRSSSVESISSGGFSHKFDPNDPCTYSTVRKYKCFLDASDASAAPVNKCQRTQQLLRRCPGRPVEVVESETEYTQGDAANGSASFWGKENDRALPFPGQPQGSEQQPWSHVPKPSIEPDWPRGFQHRDERRPAPVPGTFSGFGGIMDAIEDVIRETEDMAHSFLHVFGLDGDETNNSGNPFDRWFGGDMFGGTERRAPRRSEDDASARATSKPDMFDPKDFREV